MLQRALPFHYRPALEIISRQLAEYRLEIHLAITERAEPSCTLDPARVAAVYPLFARGVELGVLYVERFDTFVVMVDISQVIQALQHEMRRVIQQAGPGVVIHLFQETLVAYPVMQVLARMDFVADIHALLIKHIQYWAPPFSQFGKTRIDQPLWAL